MGLKKKNEKVKKMSTTVKSNWRPKDDVDSKHTLTAWFPSAAISNQYCGGGLTHQSMNACFTLSDC